MTKKDTFDFPSYYHFPPFFTIQPNSSTRHAQLQKWTTFILSYARHHKLFKLSLSDTLDTELFHNKTIGKRLSREDAKEVVEFMRREGRAEWISGKAIDGTSGVFWVWWKNVEEWGESIVNWIDETAQKNVVLTLYELTEGESTISQGRLFPGHYSCLVNPNYREEFHGLHPEILQKALAGLVKRGKAQVFGQEDQQGVKFF
ncbi:Vacuolar protein-sorting-associated protein 25 [Golovinomyces cichoracearum]|uniref:Vacuolar protein-sorting-associated protein 25 n=1 Tax=Golovinomyces cichoracearum TaxID=62708 RepID=A0A420IUR7_9PEZI|nr:Vacuolar protein-sorting-associated protein 25 [Golovinomyces cichoracearum]